MAGVVLLSGRISAAFGYCGKHPDQPGGRWVSLAPQQVGFRVCFLFCSKPVDRQEYWEEEAPASSLGKCIKIPEINRTNKTERKGIKLRRLCVHGKTGGGRWRSHPSVRKPHLSGGRSGARPFQLGLFCFVLFCYTHKHTS